MKHCVFITMNKRKKPYNLHGVRTKHWRSCA